MDRTFWLKRVNVLLFVFLLYQGATGLFSDLMNDKIFAVIHPAGGILLVLTAAAHVWLNRGWVRSVYLPGRTDKGE